MDLGGAVELAGKRFLLAQGNCDIKVAASFSIHCPRPVAGWFGAAEDMSCWQHPPPPHHGSRIPILKCRVQWYPGTAGITRGWHTLLPWLSGMEIRVGCCPPLTGEAETCSSRSGSELNCPVSWSALVAEVCVTDAEACEGFPYCFFKKKSTLSSCASLSPRSCMGQGFLPSILCCWLFPSALASICVACSGSHDGPFGTAPGTWTYIGGSRKVFYPG